MASRDPGPPMNSAQLLADRFATALPLRLDREGVIRIGRTRVPLDTVVRTYENGASPEEIVLAYDSLTLADVHSAVGFYLGHCAEVNEYLRERESQRSAVREQNEQRSAQSSLRERLLARRARAA
jgi:uncharacterized protein (DUF433 family)